MEFSATTAAAEEVQINSRVDNGDAIKKIKSTLEVAQGLMDQTAPVNDTNGTISLGGSETTQPTDNVIKAVRAEPFEKRSEASPAKISQVRLGGQ